MLPADAALEAAARELMAAAGRPELLVNGWDDDALVSPYEREAWRVCAARCVGAWLAAAGLELERLT